MPVLLPVLALLVAPAQAGTITVTKNGITPAILHVDGAKEGKVKKTEASVVTTKDGVHEVAISLDPEGEFIRCLGTVDLSGSAKVVVNDNGCTGLTDGKPADKSVGKGGWIHVRGPEVGGKEVSVDGGRAWYAPEDGFLINVAPGKHIVSLTEHCQGTVLVDEGATAPLVVQSKTCEGFAADADKDKDKDGAAPEPREKPEGGPTKDKAPQKGD
jgi:hypothetical protein